MLPAFFSSDGSFLLQFLVIFLTILVLLMGVVLLFRRLTGRGLSLANGAGQRGRQPRLGIVDIYELDRQRQLILLRRDNVEHLLLVGGPTDVVVERNIQRSGSARLAGETASRPEPVPDPEPDPDAAAAAPRFPAPDFEMPAAIPAPLPGSAEPQPVRGPSLDPALFEPEAVPAAPQRPRGGPSASRLLRRTPPPLVNPHPDVASERTAIGETPPVIRTPEARTVDPAILSDMARQLEVALRRPASAVTPAPGRIAEAPEPALPPEATAAPEPTPEPAAPAPVVPPSPTEPQRPQPRAVASKPPQPSPEPAAAARPSEPPDPIAAAMAASQALNPPVSLASAPSEAPVAPPARPVAPEPVAEAAPVPMPPPAPTAPPAPVPAPASAPAAAAAPAPKEAAGASAPSPFSVEEIEAEFARLLGRPLDKKG